MRNSLLNAVAAASLLMVASPVLAKGTWVSVSLQNSEATSLFVINDSNTIAGQYTDTSGNVHGFVGPFSGENYTSFDDAGGDTEPRGMNNSDVITGYDVGTLTPWERSVKGTITNITKDGTTLDQLAQGINKSGVFVGDYTDETTGLYVGYLGKKAKWTGDIALSTKNDGYAGRAIDNAGDVGGWYEDPTTDTQVGYLLMAGAKKPVLIDYPKSVYTVVEGLNNKGLVVGQWEDTSGIIHSFFYTVKKGKFTSLDAPGATEFTQAWNINDNNVIAVSSDAGSFVYCISAKKCPGSDAGAVKTPQSHRKYTPAAP
ncbi:MAG TPA: hypothetical protein VMF67_04665 [Rhizomicrobium sp.]|nr:hypothetical protein [Rhizomicrobium sp.]